jgi:hypothetical protein
MLGLAMTRATYHKNLQDNDAYDDKDELLGIASPLVACNLGFFLYIVHHLQL